MRTPSAAWNPIDDLKRVRLADRRHDRRVVAVARRAMAAPGASFPRMMHDDSELEATYRLLSNPDVSPESILDAHYRATSSRARASGQPTVVVHDTTECCFRGDSEREGVGRISNSARGLSVHVALALSPDGAPHGLLNVSTSTRLSPPRPRRDRKKMPRPHSQRESARWMAGVAASTTRLGEGPNNAVHVMDREADNYLLFDGLTSAGCAFVIRLAQNRRIVDDEHDYLREATDHIDAAITREAKASLRSDRYRQNETKKKHPARKAREAHLAIGARTVTIPVADGQGRLVERRKISLNVVRVWEPDPPLGEEPIEWLLLTNLPVDSVAKLEIIVDLYRLRWTVEEYFKALKTGCAFERRQLESRHALENALAILAPIACRLLFLRTLARRDDGTPAADLLTATQLEILRVLARRYPLPPRPTARDALLSIAGIGGFLKRNGEPGWQTIGLGFDELLRAELLWKAAKSGRRCDLS